MQMVEHSVGWRFSGEPQVDTKANCSLSSGWKLGWGGVHLVDQGEGVLLENFVVNFFPKKFQVKLRLRQSTSCKPEQF